MLHAHEICQNNLKKYDKILLYFMSDGGCKYPEKGIKRLLNDDALI